MADNYDDYSREELLRELRLRDRRPRFGLVWERKEIDHEKAVNEDFVALDFDPALSCGVAPFRDLIIESDNFDALRYLRMTHAGKIKCIYIDPPYNTGNRDFIYNDRFVDKEDAYRHSKWLEFMYRRLQLARDLLAEDGVIFVSIDDNEVFNLGLLMNQVFGEVNWISTLIWKKSYGGGAKAKHIVGLHEYIICYAFNKEAINKIDIPPDEGIRRYYKFSDEKIDQRGPYRLQPLATTSMDVRPNLRYAIPFEGQKIWPEKQWQWSQERTFAALANNELAISKTKNGWSVNYKQYLLTNDGDERTAKMYSVLDGPYTQAGTAEVKDILGDGKAFTFPKPSGLIYSLFKHLHQDKDAIVLDFFAGSGTTAHAVMKLNAEDGGNRRFILVSSTEATEEQIPPNPPFSKGGVKKEGADNLTKEGADNLVKAGADSMVIKGYEDYPPFEKGGQGGFSNKNLCRDVCAERVRRVMQGYTNKKGEAVAGLGGSFAYLRTRRLPSETLFSTIQHEAIWTALCLIHAESLSPFVADALIQQVVLENLAVLYLPNINEAVLQDLQSLIAKASALVIYTWQPGLLRQHFDDDRLSFLPIPQFLVDRFGTGSKA